MAFQNYRCYCCQSKHPQERLVELSKSCSITRQKKREVPYSELTSSAPLYLSSFQALYLAMQVPLISESNCCRRALWKAMNSDLLKMIGQHWPFFPHPLDFRLIGTIALSNSLGFLDGDGRR